MNRQMQKISGKYAQNVEDFIRSGAVLTLREKKRLLMLERLEMLSRYDAFSKEELGRKIAEGSVAEHPAWEDLIEIKNIELEMAEIENDIGML